MAFCPEEVLGAKEEFYSRRLESSFQHPSASTIQTLSDGEKEVLNIIAYLYQFRHLSNILLWIHLNLISMQRLNHAYTTLCVGWHRRINTGYRHTA